jgi:hypothetical protein
MKKLDHFYFGQKEPLQSCYLALHDIILSIDSQITPEWKYGLPFFCYRGKMLCYLHFSKVYKQPYIGFMKGNVLTGDDLLCEGRKLVKIYLFDHGKDLDVARINFLIFSCIYEIDRHLK